MIGVRIRLDKFIKCLFLSLFFRLPSIHRQFHDPLYVQRCTLLSIKTGACSEDCAYCPQSARYATDLKPEPLMDVQSVATAAKQAKEAGSTRFCMGAAWREVKDNQDFDQNSGYGKRS